MAASPGALRPFDFNANAARTKISKIGFVFPGQGSQFVGMAQDLYDGLAEVKHLYQNASEILDFNLSEVSFSGPEESLKQTRVTQPAIFVHSAAVTQVLKAKGIKPAMAAGHSLGEYSALYAAGAFTFEDGLRLVKLRAELMQKAGEIEPGTMAAVVGMNASELTLVCEEASAVGVVKIANHNSPSQLVISGTVAGVKKAMEMAKEKGAKLVIPLPVSGAFHSPLMEHAMDGLTQALDEIDFNEAGVPVYSNVHAKPVKGAKEVRDCLKQQLTSPVLWMRSVENMMADGAKEFLEVGPKNVLTGLQKRIDRAIPAKAVGTLAEVEAL